MALSAASYSLLPLPSSTSRPSTLITQSLSSSSSSSTAAAATSNGNTRRMLLATTGSILFQSLAARSELEEEGEEEDAAVNIFKENSPSVVCIKDLQLMVDNRSSTLGSGGGVNDDGAAKVEGTGSGFIWDDKGHIVTNYHVIAKFATDNTGLQRCKVLIQDSNGNSTAMEGKLVGYDPGRDLAVLKIDTNGHNLRPAVIGTSRDLTVGQSCYAIGNPFGYEHTLTTGVVSGLGREIPSSNGESIRGAIQTDAAINAGNSGGPLIDSYGRVIGVNTATFTRKGSGLSSGVNFAIPIDTVVRTVPYLIVYGTSTLN